MRISEGSSDVCSSDLFHRNAASSSPSSPATARPSSTERQNVASTPTIRPVLTKADRKAFVDLPFRLYRDDPNWVPPLKTEALGLITPEMNGWFSHAEAQLFLAERDGRVVGRISAHIDTLALTMPAEQGFGPGRSEEHTSGTPVTNAH